MSAIDLCAMGPVADDLLEHLRAFVTHLFALDARLRRPALPLPDSVNGDGQIVSSLLLRDLLALRPAEGDRLLGLTERDLSLPMLTFVFGHAQLGGPAAVVSLARLRQEFWGLRPDPDLFLSRAEREVAHELGHTFGLRHCSQPGCCMSLSTSIEEVDQKRAEFCRACRALVRERQAHERSLYGVSPDPQRPREEVES